ncbi:MAG: DUF4381 family protein [Lysobacteraceae bacterium]
MTTNLPGLRDIHLPPPPGWWPPAPGWWALAVVLLIVVSWTVRRMLRLRSRRRRIRNALHAYDVALANAGGASARIAAASEALRRAAKWREPSAALLEGDAWLRFLDGDDPAKPFSNGDGKLLRDGGFRRSVDEDVAPTLTLARARFVQLLERVDA